MTGDSGASEDGSRWDALRAHLRGALSCQTLDFDPPRLLSGGAIQQNYSLTLCVEDGPLAGRHELVLRTDAPSGVSSSLSRAEEFRVLKAAFDAGVTVPEPLLLCEGESVLGRPFYLMRRVGGIAAGHKLVRAQWRDDERRQLVRQLGAELAHLHSIKPPMVDIAPVQDLLATPDWLSTSDLVTPSGLENLPGLDMAPSKFRIQTYRMYLDDLGQPQPLLEWALRWLERHAPAQESLALCHGDFRTGNFMVEDTKLTGVLDWEFASWSNPYEDLGWLCARCWRFGRFEREVGGIGDKADLLEGYAAAGGELLAVERVTYWEIMATVRWAVIALQQGVRHTSGQEPSLELALTGRMVPEMEIDILDQIESIQARGLEST